MSAPRFYSLPAVELEELHLAAERIGIVEEDALATAIRLLTDRATRPPIAEIRKLVRALPNVDAIGPARPSTERGLG
jgi:hypothetical protein